jgi:hypothetical protein
VHPRQRMRFLFVVVSSAVVAAALAVCACHGGVPQPPAAAQPPDAFVVVPYPPPPGRVEFLPDRPRKDALWVNGQWQWTGDEWHWQHGGWYAVPPGVGFSRWETKRERGGTLLFAPASWRDDRGAAVSTPALLARATAGPNRQETAESEEEEVDASAEAGLADAPTIFDGDLFDAAALRRPILSESGLEPTPDGAPGQSR